MGQLKLSASRIKTAESCSWLYYTNYVLRFPRSGNDGSNRGSVVHTILECLQAPRRKGHVEKLKQDIQSIPSVNRLLTKLAKSHSVYTPENMKMMYGFISVGLKSDFHYDGSELQPPEYDFVIGDPEVDGYSALGFIDKHAIYHDQKLVRIGDYKSSKGKFSADELENNVQAMMYSLVMAKKYPEYDSIVDFIFLKFAKSPVISVSYTKQQLAGFEEYLRNVYAHLKDFNFQDAKKNLAAGKYEKSWMCGRAEYPGETKLDGTKKWYCPMKFPFTYYAVVDDQGDNIRTAYTLDELHAKDGELVMRKKYAGCPAHFD